MAPILPLIQAAAGAVQLGSTLLNRPRKQDFSPNTDFLRRYIADVRSRNQQNETFNAVIQPQLRTIGNQSQQLNRQLDFQAARNQPGAGVETQATLSAAQQTNQALQQASERAQRAQLQATQQNQRAIDQAQLQIGQAEAQGQQDFQRALQQYRQALPGAVAGGVAQIAGGVQGFQQAQQQEEFLNAALENLPEPVRDTVRALPPEGQQRILQGITESNIERQIQQQQTRAGKIDMIQQEFAPELIQQMLPDDVQSLSGYQGDLDVLTQRLGQARQQVQLQQNVQAFENLRGVKDPEEFFSQAMPLMGTDFDAMRRTYEFLNPDATKDQTKQFDQMMDRRTTFLNQIVEERPGLSDEDIVFFAAQYGIPFENAKRFYDSFWSTRPVQISPRARNWLNDLKRNVDLPNYADQEQKADLYYEAMNSLNESPEVMEEVLLSIGTPREYVNQLIDNPMDQSPIRQGVDPNRLQTPEERELGAQLEIGQASPDAMKSELLQYFSEEEINQALNNGQTIESLYRRLRISLDATN